MKEKLTSSCSSLPCDPTLYLALKWFNTSFLARILCPNMAAISHVECPLSIASSFIPGPKVDSWMRISQSRLSGAMADGSHVSPRITIQVEYVRKKVVQIWTNQSFDLVVEGTKHLLAQLHDRPKVSHWVLLWVCESLGPEWHRVLVLWQHPIYTNVRT